VKTYLYTKKIVGFVKFYFDMVRYKNTAGCRLLTNNLVFLILTVLLLLRAW